MSFDVSWAAFQSGHKDQILALAGLTDTGRRTTDGVPEEPFCWTALATGWFLLFVNNFTYVLERIGRLSANHATLSLTIQDYVPLSLAQFHIRGRLIWSLEHDSNKGRYALSMAGQLPPQATPIREALLARQHASEGKQPRVDYLFDAPVELAASICGFRHDRFVPNLSFGIAVPA